ncbi:MAG: cytochrome c [Deltaproteobacteria bacterium]
MTAVGTAALLALLSAASPPETPQALARGEDRMRDFCFACHVFEPGPGVTNPLHPRITPEKWGTYEQAYANIGNLSRIRPQMSHAFRGNDDDRQALALFLSKLGRENVVPWWRRALPYAGLGLAVAAAGAWFIRASWSMRAIRVSPDKRTARP